LSSSSSSVLFQATWPTEHRRKKIDRQNRTNIKHTHTNTQKYRIKEKRIVVLYRCPDIIIIRYNNNKNNINNNIIITTTTTTTTTTTNSYRESAA